MFDIAVSYATKEVFGLNNVEYMLMKKESEKGYERAIRLFNAEKIYNDVMKEYDLAIAKRYKTQV